jgi:hypothetical protein
VKILVRMGLHSGEPAAVGDERYVVTHELVADDVPTRVRIEQAYCLRSGEGAVARVLSIYITKTEFLAEPVHQHGGSFSGDYYCAEQLLPR